MNYQNEEFEKRYPVPRDTFRTNEGYEWRKYGRQPEAVKDFFSHWYVWKAGIDATQLHPDSSSIQSLHREMIMGDEREQELIDEIVKARYNLWVLQHVTKKELNEELDKAIKNLKEYEWQRAFEDK